MNTLGYVPPTCNIVDCPMQGVPHGHEPGEVDRLRAENSALAENLKELDAKMKKELYDQQESWTEDYRVLSEKLAKAETRLKELEDAAGVLSVAASKLEMGVGIHTYTHHECAKSGLDKDREHVLVSLPAVQALLLNKNESL